MIKELHEKLKNKETTSTSLVEKYLAEIEDKNKELNVFLRVSKGKALKEAKKVDEKIGKGEKVGVLEGIPCALKDNICVRGEKTTAASKILENYVAAYDATVTKKIKNEGSVILGKTNLDEFAMGSSTENSAFGVTKNPFDQTRVAGGSSGGSAVAVAAGMVPWALGSDTGGSIRQPASFCGVVGFKPTYGRVSRYGLLAMASSYDQIGPITKTVEDAKIVYEAIQGIDPKDNTTVEKKKNNQTSNSLKGKKIGLVKEFFETEGLDEDVAKKVLDRLDHAKEKGAEIIEVKIPNFKSALAVYYLMITSEVSSNLARMDGIRFGLNESLKEKPKSKNILDVYKFSRQEGLGDEVKRRIILGTYALSAGYYDAYYKKAQKVREVIKNELKEVFGKVDFLVSPTVPTPAFKIGEKVDDPLQMYLADIYTVGANVAMIPAISVPAGKVEREGKDLPVGLQLLGKWWDDDALLNIASKMEI